MKMRRFRKSGGQNSKGFVHLKTVVKLGVRCTAYLKTSDNKSNYFGIASELSVTT